MSEFHFDVLLRSVTGMQGDTIHLSNVGTPPLDLTSIDSAIDSPDLLARLAFSAGMARVTKLAIYEEQFDAFAEGIAGIPKLLESVSGNCGSQSATLAAETSINPRPGLRVTC